MPRFGRTNEVFARAQKSVNMDEALIHELRKRQQSHESFSDTLNRIAWTGIEAEDAADRALKLAAKAKTT